MFDLGWGEILVIAVIAILVVGPKELPRMMRTVGEWVAKARRMASHFQAGVDEMIRQSELEDLRKELRNIHRDINAPLDGASAPRQPAPPATKMVQSEPLPLPPNRSVEKPDHFEPEPEPEPEPGPEAPPAPTAPVRGPHETPAS